MCRNWLKLVNMPVQNGVTKTGIDISVKSNSIRRKLLAKEESTLQEAIVNFQIEKNYREAHKNN
jgi:hypothetical protein